MKVLHLRDIRQICKYSFLHMVHDLNGAVFSYPLAEDVQYSYKMSASKTPKGKSQEQVIAGFQELRQQQRVIASRIAEVEMDMKEHELVIELLKEVVPERRCFRLVGGALVERTVGDIIPALVSNKEQMTKFVENMTKQLEAKGKEINAYREEHNIRIRGEDDKQEKSEGDTKTGSGGGVLVANNS